MQMQTSHKSLVTCLLIALSTIALPTSGADLPNGGTLNLNIPQRNTNPVFSVDANSITPAMETYLNAVREKIQQRGMKDWPKDMSGRRMSGEVVVRITLRKDGFIDDIQTSSIPENNDELSEAVRLVVKRAEPFPSFSPSLFEGYELIAFGTTVGSAQGGGQPAGKPHVGAQGNNQRLEMRTRIPF